MSDKVCAFCDSPLDDRSNSSICSVCAYRYGISTYSSEDGCACDSR